MVPTTAQCFTSNDGSVVGMPNPLALPNTSITYGSGTMAAGIYYVVFTFYTNGNLETLASPELKVQLTGTGSLTISPPATLPRRRCGHAGLRGHDQRRRRRPRATRSDRRNVSCRMRRR